MTVEEYTQDRLAQIRSQVVKWEALRDDARNWDGAFLLAHIDNLLSRIKTLEMALSMCDKENQYWHGKAKAGDAMAQFIDGLPNPKVEEMIRAWRAK
ncbi:hypothetical protein CCP3SC15_6560003 [Gammaproteobacteria bacterium]